MDKPQTLVVFHKQLGDLLLLEPVISALSHRDEGRPIAILTRGGHAALVALLPHAVSLTHAYRHAFHHAWGFDGLHKTTLRMVLSRARKKHLCLDADTESTWYQRFLFRDLRFGARGSDYMAHYFWQIMEPRIDEVFRPPRLLVPPLEWTIPEDLPSAYFVANVSAGWRSKSWSIDGWVGFLKAWIAETGLPAVITSGAQDWQTEHAEKIHRQVPESIFLGGKTDLKQFIRILYQAKMIVTVDGFAGHVATAYERPCVTLFKGSTVKNWHYATPYSKAVVATEELNDGEARLKHLPMSPVLDAARTVMEGKFVNK